MTDDLARAEEQLRAVLTARAADIPAKDLHNRVVRRARRRRLIIVAATATAVALVAAGVPTALAVVRSDPAPRPDPAARPIPAQYRCARATTPPAAVPGLPAQRDVAGSLGDDPAAVVAIARAAWGPLSQQANGALDPALTRVQVAHRADDGWIVGLATGRDRSGRLLSDVPVVGPDLDHLTGLSNGWQEDTKPTSRRFTSGDAFASILNCGPPRVLAIVPRGASAETTWTTGIAANGTIEQEAPPLTPRPDGLAVTTLTVPPTVAVTVRVHRGNRSLATDALIGRNVPKGPSPAEMARKLQTAPGNLADRKNAVGLVDQTYRVLLPVPQRDARVLWAGQGAENVQAAAAVTTLPSGAQLLWGSTVTWDRGQSGVEPFDGVVAAGALDRTAYRLQPNKGNVLPGRARPQGIFFTGTRRVDITSGGKTRTETVTGGLMVDEAATVVVRDTDGTPLPLVDVRTDLPRVPDPQF
jgi:hypothetical protein